MVLTWFGNTVRYVSYSGTYMDGVLLYEIQIHYEGMQEDGRGHEYHTAVTAQCYIEQHKWMELFPPTDHITDEAMVAAVSLYGWCANSEIPSYDITGKFPNVHIQREKKQGTAAGTSVDDETASKINKVLSKCSDALLNAINNHAPMTPSPYARIQNRISSVYGNNQGGQVPLVNPNPTQRVIDRWSAAVNRAQGRWTDVISSTRRNVDQSGLDIDEEIKKILGTMKCAACDNSLSHPHNMQPFLGNDEMKNYIKFCNETQQAPTLFCCSCYEIAEKYPRITDAYRTMINVTYKLGEAMKGVEKQIQSTMDAEAELTEWSAELKKKEDALAARETLIVDLLKRAGIEK